MKNAICPRAVLAEYNFTRSVATSGAPVAATINAYDACTTKNCDSRISARNPSRLRLSTRARYSIIADYDLVNWT